MESQSRKFKRLELWCFDNYKSLRFFYVVQAENPNTQLRYIRIDATDTISAMFQFARSIKAGTFNLSWPKQCPYTLSESILVTSMDIGDEPSEGK